MKYDKNLMGDTDDNVREKIEDEFSKVQTILGVMNFIGVVGFLLPLISLIVTFTLVINQVLTLNEAIMIYRTVLIIFCVCGYSMFFLNKNNEGYKHKVRDLIMFIFSIIITILLLFFTFALPIKIDNYGSKEYVTISEQKIPALYKHTKNKKYFFSFKANDDSVSMYKGTAIRVKTEYIAILYTNKYPNKEEQIEEYGKELEKNGYTEYKGQVADNDDEDVRMWYMQDKENNQIVFCSINESCVTYGVATSDQQLPDAEDFLEDQLKQESMLK